MRDRDCVSKLIAGTRAVGFLAFLATGSVDAAPSRCSLILEEAAKIGVGEETRWLLEAFHMRLERRRVVANDHSVKIVGEPRAIVRSVEPTNAFLHQCEIRSGNGQTHTVEIVTTQKRSSTDDLRLIFEKIPADFLSSAEVFVYHDEPSPDEAYWSRVHGTSVEIRAMGGLDGASGKRIIHIFPAANPYLVGMIGPIRRWTLKNILRHELGHTLAWKMFGTAMPPDSWRVAMAKDKFGISDYGNTSPIEDFAEAVRLYLETGGGIRGSVRGWYPNRFAQIDAALGLHINPAMTEQEFNKAVSQMDRDPAMRSVLASLHETLSIAVFGSADGGMKLTAPDDDWNGAIVFNRFSGNLVFVEGLSPVHHEVR